MKNFILPTPDTWMSNENSKPKTSVIIVGVLALQGDFLEHILTLKKLNVQTEEVRLPKDLENIDAIIIPGGESTTIARLLDVCKLREPLREKIIGGMPVWGTCAGMILLAKKLLQDRPATLEVMDIVVDRNAYGRQIDSFETEIKIKELGEEPLRATFIRAPKIVEAGQGVEILARDESGEIIAVRQKNMMATAFHPELSNDVRMHEFFIGSIKK